MDSGLAGTGEATELDSANAMDKFGAVGELYTVLGRARVDGVLVITSGLDLVVIIGI